LGQVVLYDAFDVIRHHDGSRPTATFSGDQRACAPTFLCKPSDPAPDRGLADAKLPDCIPDTAFQASGAAEICLDKRVQDRCPAQRLSLDIATVFFPAFCRCQPPNPFHPVFDLTAEMSDLKERYHI
jgi:hypothetical protein